MDMRVTALTVWAARAVSRPSFWANMAVAPAGGTAQRTTQAQ